MVSWFLWTVAYISYGAYSIKVFCISILGSCYFNLIARNSRFFCVPLIGRGITSSLSTLMCSEVFFPESWLSPLIGIWRISCTGDHKFVPLKSLAASWLSPSRKRGESFSKLSYNCFKSLVSNLTEWIDASLILSSSDSVSLLIVAVFNARELDREEAL